jgi:hypothetical protein
MDTDTLTTALTEKVLWGRDCQDEAGRRFCRQRNGPFAELDGSRRNAHVLHAVQQLFG